MTSSRTGRSLNESAHKLAGARGPSDSPPARPGVPLIPPKDPRPRCKVPGCTAPWTGSHLLYCAAHEDEYLDLMQAQDDDMRESDTEIVW